jgi:hypothetical protein
VHSGEILRRARIDAKASNAAKLPVFEAQDEGNEIVGIGGRKLNVRHIGVAGIEKCPQGERSSRWESGYFHECWDAADVRRPERGHPMTRAAPMLGEMAAVADISAHFLGGRDVHQCRERKDRYEKACRSHRF